MDERTRSPDRADDGVRAIGDRKEAGRRQAGCDIGRVQRPRLPALPDTCTLASSLTSRPCWPTHRLPSRAPKPAQIARPDLRDDFQSEIRARVANFRAHQERFNREREAYCSATMAKVHASLREDSGLPRPGK